MSGRVKSSIAGALSRRQAIAGLGTAGMALAMPAILPIRSVRAQAMEDEVVFASNGGSYQRAIEEELFPEFSRQTGVERLTYVVGQGPENIARLRTQGDAPSIDVIWLAGAQAFQAADEGLLDTIDEGDIPNLAQLPPGLMTETMSVPATVTFMSVLYNTELFAERGFPAPTSWWDLWDTRYSGHVGSFSSNSTGQVAVLTQIARMLTGDWRNLDPAFERMRELRDQVADFFTSPGALDTAIQQREVWISLHAVQGAVQHVRNGMPIEMIQPAEGVVGYPVSVGVVRNGPHPNAARAWVNYLLSEDAQNRLAAVLGYTPVNVNAAVPDTFARFYPPTEEIFVPDWRYITGEMPSIVDRWNRIVEG